MDVIKQKRKEYYNIYRLEHELEYKQYMKEYYQKNKNKLLNYYIKYNQNKIICPCGSIYGKAYKARHIKKAIHTNYLRNAN